MGRANQINIVTHRYSCPAHHIRQRYQDLYIPQKSSLHQPHSWRRLAISRGTKHRSTEQHIGALQAQLVLIGGKAPRTTNIARSIPYATRFRIPRRTPTCPEKRHACTHNILDSYPRVLECAFLNPLVSTPVLYQSCVHKPRAHSRGREHLAPGGRSQIYFEAR